MMALVPKEQDPDLARLNDINKELFAAAKAARVLLPSQAPDLPVRAVFSLCASLSVMRCQRRLVFCGLVSCVFFCVGFFLTLRPGRSPSGPSCICRTCKP